MAEDLDTGAAAPTGDVGEAQPTNVGSPAPTEDRSSSEPLAGGKKPKAAATAAEPSEPDEKPTSSIPDDWREQLAGEDKVFLKQLQRLKSYQDIGKKLLEQEKTIRSGQHKQPLPEDATDEQIAEYRKQNGIPETPDGYLAALEGRLIGDADKPAIESFLAQAHAANADPKFVKTAVDWYYNQQEAVAEAEAARDSEFRSEAVELLREAMGPDYKRNMQDLKVWLNTEDGLFDNLVGARLADGTLLGDNPQVVNFLVSAMREINPVATVLPGVTGDPAKTLAGELEQFKQMLATKDGQEKYWSSKQLQDRYNELLNAEDKLQRKSA